MRRRGNTIEQKGLPASIEAERLVLGAIILDDSNFLLAGGKLASEDFAIEKHRRIFAAMRDMHERGDKIDRVTIAHEITSRGQIESVDGWSYLTSLDDGLPQIYNLESYIEIIRSRADARRAIQIGNLLVQSVMNSPSEYNAAVGSASAALMNLGEGDKRRDLADAIEIMESHPAGMQGILAPHKTAAGLMTHFRKLDEMTGGLHAGELIILAARPSMGKTALAMNIADKVSQNDERAVAVFSLEMTRESLLQRVICARAGVDSNSFRLGLVGAEERRRLQVALTDIAGRRLMIDDTAQIGVLEMHSKLRRAQQRHGLALAIVDYLQLLSSPESGGTRNDDVSVISRGLKLMSKDLGIPIIALSQLSRAPEQRGGEAIPRLSDLRDSGSIEQDADAVWFVHRPEYYKPQDESLRGKASLVIAKQRNGPIGTAPLVFVKEYTSFYDLRREEEWSQ